MNAESHLLIKNVHILKCFTVNWKFKLKKFWFNSKMLQYCQWNIIFNYWNKKIFFYIFEFNQNLKKEIDKNEMKYETNKIEK